MRNHLTRDEWIVLATLFIELVQLIVMILVAL